MNENSKTIEHQLIIAPFNANADNSFSRWVFYIPAEGVSSSDITHNCEIKKKWKKFRKSMYQELRY